jgi:abortive infection bacteriophage resistance protein
MNREHMKQAKTYDEQIELLENRGLIINNRANAKRILQYTNYYRLTAYGLGLKKEDNETYQDNVSIEQLYKIYRFDEKLRHLLFSIIEPIELRLRAELAYYLGTTYGNVAHLNFKLCKEPYGQKKHLGFLEQYYSSLSKSFSSAFVSHNINEYGELPIWAAVEILTFGTLSKYYGNLRKEIQREVAKTFNSDGDKLSGWFESLCEVRNICAHSGRIYNRRLNKKPKLYPGNDKGFNEGMSYKIFPRIIIIKKIYSGKGDFQTFITNLSSLVDEYSEYINLEHLGFPKYWRHTIDKVSPETNIFIE